MLANPIPEPSEPDVASENPGAIHWPSAWQFGVGLLASLGLWAMAIILVVLALTGIAFPSIEADITSVFLLASGLVLCGLLILPSIGYASARLFNRSFTLPRWVDLKTWQRAALLLPFVILIGHWISSRQILSWVLLPPIHLAALGLPILWLLWRGTRGLSLREPEMAWGIFATGLAVSPALILILEMLAGAAIFFVGIFFLSLDQSAVTNLSALLEQIGSANENIDLLIRLLEPYLARPPVAFTIFAFAAGIVPIIEETLKPLGVWLLPGRGTTPAEGFVAGLLCGAGYALFENLALASSSQGWAFAVTARAGTSLLHMVTSGLMGWALVLAWSKARYGLMFLVYLTSITIHGLWNGLTLLSISNILSLPGDHPLLIVQKMGIAAPFGLVALLVVSMAILLAANRSFKSRPAKLPEKDTLWT
jgi:hypothetical protein